jgi:hypothetical protein
MVILVCIHITRARNRTILKRGSFSNLPFRLYCLNVKRQVWGRAKLAFKWYDILFYLVLAVVIYVMTHFLGGNPWSFAVHKCTITTDLLF